MRSAAVAACVAALAGSPVRAQAAPARVALVIGEGAYGTGPMPAAPNDAGLVAQVLAGAGFDVTGARDLDGDGLRRAFRDFVDKAGAAGPDGIAVVYFAGRAVQSDGDDYLVPVDARLARPGDVSIEALRLADFTHALAGLPIQARVVVVDGAYAGGPGQGAPGLSLVEAEQGSLIAFNAAPGTAAPATAGPYGTYAQALVGAIKQGGVPVGEVFDRVRLAVDQASGGAEVPWDSDHLTRSFAFFDRAPGAPAVASAGVPFSSLQKRPLRDFPPDQAFDVALARDTVPAYAEFLAAFPNDPLARRVRLIQAVRREALFWRAAVGGNTPGAYWTYLARYPNGPHAADARRRLTRLAAAAAPPPRFVPLPFDVPPPGPDDLPYDGPIAFVAPDLPPPPPPPVFLLPPIAEAPPPRPVPPPGPLLLPIPVPVAVPNVRPPIEPGSIAPPRGAADGYAHPRPYKVGPNGDGLVVQAPPEPPPPAPLGRQPAAPPALPVPPAPQSPRPVSPPSARPVPQPALPTAGPPSTAPSPAIPPQVPAVRPPVPPAGTPAAPTPSPRPLPQPSPSAGTPQPEPVAPPTPVPAHRPPGHVSPPPPAPAPPATAPAAPVPPPAHALPPAGQGGVLRPAPASPPPKDLGAPARPVPPPAHVPPSVRQGGGPRPAAASPPPSTHGAPAQPVEPPAVAQPTRPPEAPRPAPAPAPAAPPDARPPHQQPRPDAPDRPAPDRPGAGRPGPDHPEAGAAAGHPPGAHREACGRPGEPPCRP